MKKIFINLHCNGQNTPQLILAEFASLSRRVAIINYLIATLL